MFTKITIYITVTVMYSPVKRHQLPCFTAQYDGLNHAFFNNHNHKLESKNNENHDWRAPFDTYLPTICFILQQQNCTVKEAIWGLNYVQQLGSFLSGSPALSNSPKCLSNFPWASLSSQSKKKKSLGQSFHIYCANIHYEYFCHQIFSFLKKLDYKPCMHVDLNYAM